MRLREGWKVNSWRSERLDGTDSRESFTEESCCNGDKQSGSIRTMTEDTTAHLPAGDFSSWLRSFRNALLRESGMDVPCGDCIGCCSSHQFIHVRPDESRTLARIPKNLLAAAPGLPKGTMLMGYDRKGFCPMMKKGTCSIYEHRPLTCRIYDCRAFAAAGLVPGGENKTRIIEQVRCWKFGYPSVHDREEHEAVQAAAKFIRDHAPCFPGGRVPDDPGQLAILAIKAYTVFFSNDRGPGGAVGHAPTTADRAAAIVEACRQFDATMSERRPT